LIHSIWVIAIEYVSRRNMELEAMWAFQYSLDMPISLAAQPFLDLCDKLSPTPIDSYHFGNFVFFLFAGGAQFFLWGFLAGYLINMFLKKGSI